MRRGPALAHRRRCRSAPLNLTLGSDITLKAWVVPNGLYVGKKHDCAVQCSMIALLKSQAGETSSGSCTAERRTQLKFREHLSSTSSWVKMAASKSCGSACASTADPSARCFQAAGRPADLAGMARRKSGAVSRRRAGKALSLDVRGAPRSTVRSRSTESEAARQMISLPGSCFKDLCNCSRTFKKEKILTDLTNCKALALLSRGFFGSIRFGGLIVWDCD